MMRTFLTLSLIVVAAVLTGCAANSSSTKKTTANSSVLDVSPAPSKSTPYTAAYVAPDGPPSDSITYTTTPASGTYASIAPVTVKPAVIAEPAAAGSKYKVKPGDTLFGIAKTNYGDGKQWNRIASANPGLSPKSLKAGQTITIP